jgi:branched-chain amino acid transport system substrate-binding protein
MQVGVTIAAFCTVVRPRSVLDVSGDTTTRTFDRGSLLKRAGAAAAVTGIPLAGASGAWAGLTRPAAAKELRIGNLLTLSGPNAAPAIDVKKGFVTYVLAHNHRIGGRKIRFFDADDAGDPATGIRQVQKLASEDHVDVIEGIFYSSILLGVRDTINSLKIPTVVANAAANAITREYKSAYMFRTSYTNYQLGASMAKWCADRLTKSGMAILAANYAAGQESSAAFKQVYEAAGGNVAATILTPFPTTPDYQPYLGQAADKGAKALWVFAAGGGESIKLVKTYKQFGFDRQFPLVGINNVTDPQSVLDSQGDAAVGIRTSANWAPSLKNAENAKFLKAYNRFGGEPSAFAELGYIAAQYLDLAIKKVHGDTSNKTRFLKALASVGTWQSPGGRLTMDAKTHQVALPFYLRQVVKNGSSYDEKLIATLGTIKDPGQ